MRSMIRRPWMLVAVFAAWVLVPAPSAALTYSSSCDLFAVDGNEFGSADGAFDYVDEFDDGTLAPAWTLLLGTAVESGGTVTVRNPGVTIPLGTGGVLEISTIENEEHGIADGAGDFTMISDWGVVLPATNSEFHMQLYSISPIIEAAGITVNNTSPEVAAAQPGGIAGYSVSQSVTQGFGDDFTVVQANAVPISAASVTGHVILRMTFDDATNMLTCAFSLDDGQTFQSFPPMHVFNGGVNDYDVLLGAAGITPPPPPPAPFLVPLKSFELKNPSTPAARKLRYAAKAPGLYAPNFGYLTALGGVLAVKMDVTPQCFTLPPGAAWSAKSGGNGYTYRDTKGVNGPVKVMSVRRSSNGTFQTKAVIVGRNGALDLVPPNPGVRADVALALGSGAEYCTSTAGGTIVKNDAKSFKAKNAPAPAMCGLTGCSPGGAFLD
jgi:hypothetical protein